MKPSPLASFWKTIEKTYKDIRTRNLSKRQLVMMSTGFVFILLFLSGGIYYTIRVFTRGETCFSTAQVASDSRCLYIYNNQVFEKGTKSAPHHDIPCGTDVSSIIPNSHLIDKVGHLDPNYQGNICSNQPVPTAAQPTSAPTNTPVPPTAIPTQPPANNGGNQQTQATATPVRAATPTTASSSTQSTTSSVVTSTPIQSSSSTAGTLSPTISQLPVTGATETAIGAVSAGLIIIGALRLIF